MNTKQAWHLALIACQTLERIPTRDLSQETIKTHVRRQWAADDRYHQLSAAFTTELARAA